jgi:hypothetical protein
VAESPPPDLYEVLQVSSTADAETIDRVFRHLAKRYHPDNAESGDTDRFTRVMQAFELLSDPEQRARYDSGRDQALRARWRVFDQGTATDDLAADRRVRVALLSILYTARRNDAEQPGLGVVDLERMLGCPEHHMKFHVWYLRENGLMQRLDNGLLAITSKGVDWVLDLGGPVHAGRALLEAGESGSSANGNGAGNGAVTAAAG